MAVTTATRKYNIIYVYSVPYEDHKGLLKIGKAEVDVEEDYYPTPNDEPMTKAAEKRIAEQLGTGGFKHQLEYTEVAHYRDDNGKGKSFIDIDVHTVLRNSGYQNHDFGEDISGGEWFPVTLETAIEAIHAVKEERQSLTAPKHSIPEEEIHFREEQDDAINRTITHFGFGDKMLWNAKMRFGKTLCALEVARQMDSKRTLILTHRPAVRDGWFEDFDKIKFEHYQRGSKPRPDGSIPKGGPGQSFESMEKDLRNNGTHYIYFMSMQDLRGSKETGGKFDKNASIFSTNWDLVILDEAHEGTQTKLGKAVITALQKRKPKMLYLSGTPYNILDQFNGSEIYTWDYVKEQQAKEGWATKHPGVPNPYEGLPRMNIHTYSMGSAFETYKHAENDYFDFREFFRVWTGDAEVDNGEMPSYAQVGDFVHKEDVRAFLDLLTKEDPDSNYPFANELFRGYFQHSFWVVPGVKAAAALTTMLEEHPIFRSFKVVNVAGEGGKLASADLEDEPQDESLEEMENSEAEIKAALGKVKSAIANNKRTITISCGRLTTGVTVPEWTAVLMLAGSYSTKAATYMQTIFRVQSPAKDGTIKHECYAFDFAPDRTVTVVNDYLNVARKLDEEKSGEEAQKKEKGHHGDAHGRYTDSFLHFCPIISFDGSETKPLETIPFMTKVNRAIADQIYHKGFNDHRLFSRFDDVTMKDLEFLSRVEKLFGSAAKSTMSNEGKITVNEQGLTGEDAPRDSGDTPKPTDKNKKKPTDKKQSSYKESLKRYQQLMGAVAKRFPLLLFGAVDNLDREHWSLQQFVADMDKADWEQFMPRGYTQEEFLKMQHLFNNDFFITSTQLLLEDTREADTLPVSERVSKMAHILQRFHYPDKETVLTPWRVVNLHMTDTIGGYSFYKDDKFLKEAFEPQLIEQDITREVFAPDSKLLEINSKSGVYPLWLAYTLFRFRCEEQGNNLTREQEQTIWDNVVRDQLFVLCKTEMAKRITERVLVGYRTDIKPMCQYEPDLLKILKDEERKQRLVKRLKKYSYWGIENMEPNKFDFKAIVGNPPYQEMDGGNSASARPVYHYFASLAKDLTPSYFSLIMPARWYAGGKGLDDFRSKMLKDKQIVKLVDFANSSDCFPKVNIAGGISYFLWRKNANEDCEITNMSQGKVVSVVKRDLSQYSILVRDNNAYDTIQKILGEPEMMMSSRVRSRNSFNLPSNFRGHSTKAEGDYMLLTSNGTSYVKPQRLNVSDELLSQYKVVITYAMSGGNKPSSDGSYQIISSLTILKPQEICTETFLVLDAFKSEQEAMGLYNYAKTKFFRFLLLQSLTSIHITKDTFRFVPLQDFTANSDINWNQSVVDIDKQLYAKYNLSPDEIAFIEKMIKPME